MISRITVVTIVAILLASLFLVYATIQSFYRINNIGNVQTIGIQLLDESMQPVTFIDWGNFDPNTTKSYAYFLNNNGTVALTASFNTSNWVPNNASSHIILSWNYVGQTITALTSLPINFTLTISDSISGISNFSFDLTIVGTKV